MRKMTDPKELYKAHIPPVSLTSLKWIGVDYRTQKEKKLGPIHFYSVWEQLVSLNGRD